MALPLTLHTWTGAWSLPSIDPASIAIACYLQLAFPGRWTHLESNDPDSSPNGQLPYIEHGPHIISSPSGIRAYLLRLSPESATLTPEHRVQGLSEDGVSEPLNSPSHRPPRSGDLDENLTDGQKAQSIAWQALIEGELADLTSHTLYSPAANFALVHSHLMASLPFPQSQFLPNRIRTLHEARLTHVSLWGLASATTPPTPQNRHDGTGLGLANVEKLEPPVQAAAKQLEGAFAEAEFLQFADRTLALLSSLVSTSSTGFAFDSPTPTSLDLALFSHLSLILLPPFPVALLPNHIRTNHPALQAHTLRILSLCFPPDSPDTWPHRPAVHLSVWGSLKRGMAAVPTILRVLGGGSQEQQNGVTKTAKDPPTEAERDFARKRLWWFAGSAVALVGYVFASGIIQFEFEDEDEGGEFYEEEDGVENEA